MSWWSGAFFVARKDVEYMLRRRETIVWTFVMPLMFFFFIGTITAGFGGDPNVRERIALEGPDDGGFVLDQLVMRLEQQDFEVVRPPADDGTVDRRKLVVPERLTDRVLAGEPVTLEFVRHGGGLGGEYDELRVGRAVYTVLADLIAAPDDAGQPPTAAAVERLNEAPRALTLRVTPAGERREPPTGFEQAVPGTMVMFTLLVLLTSGAVLLVVERRQGLLRRLASTPIPRSAVVAGKGGGKLVLGLVQIAFAMMAGSLFFGMDWGNQLPMVLVVLLAYATLTAALGVVLGSVARTEGQAAGLGVLGANVLAALGGCWWPIEITPQWMQSVSRFLPTGATMDALHRLVSFGLPASAVWPHLVGLMLGSIVVGWFATRSFRFQ